MRNANVMYGVTMQQRGISKVVSVKFSEYKPDNMPATTVQVAEKVEEPAKAEELAKAEDSREEELAAV
jgi:hypothetical protein